MSEANNFVTRAWHSSKYLKTAVISGSDKSEKRQSTWKFTLENKTTMEESP